MQNEHNLNRLVIVFDNAGSSDHHTEKTATVLKFPQIAPGKKHEIILTEKIKC